MQHTDFSTTTPSQTRSSEIGWALIVFLAIVTALDALAIDMYLPSFPAVMKDLGISSGEIQQTLSIFLAGLALGQGICGPILERYGRRKPLLIGLAIFCAGSALAAMSESLSVLLVARLIQALGASFGLTAPRAIISETLDSVQAAKAFSIVMQVMMIAPVIAPAIGSNIMVLGSWRWVFWVLALFAAITFIWGLKITPETLPQEKRKPINTRNVLNSYKDLLLNRPYLLYMLSGAILMGGLFVYISTASLIFIEHFQLTPVVFSYLFGGNAIGMILLGQLNILLLRKFTPKKLAAVGLLMYAIAGGSLAIVHNIFELGWFSYYLILALAIWSMGLVFGNLSAITMDEVKEDVGMASSLMGLFQYGVGAVMALLVSLLPHNLYNLPLCFFLSGLLGFFLLRIAKPSAL